MTPQPTEQELDIKLRTDLRTIKRLTREIVSRHQSGQRNFSQLFYVTDCLATAKTILNSYPESYLDIPRVQIKVDRAYTQLLLSSSSFLSFIKHFLR